MKRLLFLLLIPNLAFACNVESLALNHIKKIGEKIKIEKPAVKVEQEMRMEWQILLFKEPKPQVAGCYHQKTIYLYRNWLANTWQECRNKRNWAKKLAVHEYAHHVCILRWDDYTESCAEKGEHALAKIVWNKKLKVFSKNIKLTKREINKYR